MKSLVCFALLAMLPQLEAAPVTFTFEGLGDSTPLANQYSGLTFTNANVLTAGLSLNEIDFPPFSGTNVLGDFGGPVSINFASAILSFSGYFTYSSQVRIDAFDLLNQSVGSTASAFTVNTGSSGNPVNELLQVSFAGGISRIVITGASGGNSFAMDDATVTTPNALSDVPEPSTLALFFLGFAAIGACRIRRV